MQHANLIDEGNEGTLNAVSDGLKEYNGVVVGEYLCFDT
jgi:hypothetical protein